MQNLLTFGFFIVKCFMLIDKKLIIIYNLNRYF